MNREPILKSHRKPEGSTTVVEVGDVRFGDGSYPVIAGPCAVESGEQIAASAAIAREGGAAMLWGGTFKQSSSPYGFAGLGAEGVSLLAEAGRQSGLPTLSAVLEPDAVDIVAEQIDMVMVGADNMQNFALLKAVGDQPKPVLLKRGTSATVDEWLMAAEYVLNGGNEAVVLCERGIRTFETRTRHTLDISSVPVVQGLSHLPVIVDPSHAAGLRDLIVPLALAGRAVGADGLLVEMHPDPEQSLSEGPQQLDREGYLALMEALGVPRLRDEIDRIDREIIRLLARRVDHAVEIGRMKTARGIPLRSPDREVELLDEVRQEAADLGLDADHAEALFQLVLVQSRAAQREALG